jgi:molybdate transport system substrate-binding protein
MRLFTLTLLWTLLLITTAASAADTKLFIAAAADLRFLMPELVKAFKKDNPDTFVQTSFESSGTLAAQIEEKAPFDIFLSADSSYPKHLIEKGLVDGNRDFVYAQGSIVVWYSKNSHLHLSRTDLGKGMKLLLDPRIKKIAIANPNHAPYGKAAVAALQNEGIYDLVKSKFVTGDNISQAAEFAQTGAADVGIIALSLAGSPQLRAMGDYFAVPKSDYPALVQSLVIVKDSNDKAQAEKFKAVVLDQKNKTLFTQFGFEN